jgi:hypothetical protein
MGRRGASRSVAVDDEVPHPHQRPLRPTTSLISGGAVWGGYRTIRRVQGWRGAPAGATGGAEDEERQTVPCAGEETTGEGWYATAARSSVVPRGRPGGKPYLLLPFPSLLPSPRRRRRVPPGKARAVPAAADLLVPACEEDNARLYRSGGEVLQRLVDESLAWWAGEPRTRRPLVVKAAKLGGVMASFYRDWGLRRAGWSSGRLCGGSWWQGCRRCPLPFGRHAESGPIWVCHGPGGRVVARNGRGEEVVPGQWMSVLAVARC